MQEESAIAEVPAVEAKVEKSVLKRTRQIKQIVQSEHHEIVESTPDQKDGIVSKRSGPRVVHSQLQSEPQPLQKPNSRKETPRDAAPVVERFVTQAPALSPAVRRAASDSTHSAKMQAPAVPQASRHFPAPLKPDQTLQRPASVVRVTKEIEVQQHKSQRPVKPATPPAIRQGVRQNIVSPTPVPDKSPALPAIQVTIGRVEIRANQSATPLRGNVRSAPKVTLDDYLRMRNGGAR